MIEWHSVIKWIHIVNSTILFGAGLGTAFQMLMAHRRRDIKTLPVVFENVVLADWIFTTPAIVIQPLSGAVLAYILGYSLMETWLVVTYLLYILAGACWIPVVFIQIRLAKLTRECLENNVPLPQEYDQMMRLWFWLGWPAFLSLLATYFIMIEKPSFW